MNFDECKPWTYGMLGYRYNGEYYEVIQEEAEVRPTQTPWPTAPALICLVGSMATKVLLCLFCLDSQLYHT